MHYQNHRVPAPNSSNHGWNNNNIQHQYKHPPPSQANYIRPCTPVFPPRNESHTLLNSRPYQPNHQYFTVNVNRPPPGLPPNFQRPPPSFHQQALPINTQRPPPSLSHNANHFSQTHGHPAVPVPLNDSHISYDNAGNSLQQSFNVNNSSHQTHVGNTQFQLPHVLQQNNFTPNSQQYSHSQHPVNIPVTLSETNNTTNLSESLSELEKKRKTGDLKLKEWLQKTGKLKTKREVSVKDATTNVKINQFITNLQLSFSILNKMTIQVDKMGSMIQDADRSIWQEECNTIHQLKVEHADLQNIVDKVRVRKVQNKLQRIKSKKARLKRMAQDRLQQKGELESIRRLKEKEIDEWQEKISLDMKEESMKKKRKEEMDQHLGEISRKINDANRLIETMTALEKLRLIRQDAAKKRGDADLGESRESFEQKIADMTRLVRCQLEVYKEEEEQIRNAIQSEQDATSEKERQLQEQQELEAKMQKDVEMYKKLFGDAGDVNVTDPLFPFQQYYKQAQTSLQAFLQIRHDWDHWLVSPENPHGSSIPQDWVHPPEPSNKTWAKALV